MEPYQLENLSNTDLRDVLENQRACQDALDWLGERDLRQAWSECPHLDWLDWGIAHIAPLDAEIHFNVARQVALEDANIELHEIYDAGLDDQEEEKRTREVWYKYVQTCKDAVVIVDKEPSHVES